ncbi:MAG: phosphodiesterase/alkaline phosphatase D-like protein, partial [Bacteroidia bacterium]
MNSRSFLRIAVAFVLFVCSQPLLAQTEIIGPLVGHTDTKSTHIWARMVSEGEYTLEIKSEKKTLQKLKENALIENDLCITWKVSDLSPATSYQYQIKKGKDVISQGSNLKFRTAPSAISKTPVRLAFGSGSSYTE